MFERLSSQAGRTPAGLGAASAGCESAANARRLRRHPVGRSRCMIAKPPCAKSPVSSPARSEHVQSLRRLLDPLAPADRQAEQKCGQRCRGPGHAVCHVARKVKDGLDIRLLGIKPEFRAGRLGPLVKGVHHPNLNGCRDDAAARPASQDRGVEPAAGPSPRPRGTGLAATDLPGYMNRLFSRRSRTLACPVAGTCPDASGASLAGTWCSVRGATGRVSRRTGSR